MFTVSRFAVSLRPLLLAACALFLGIFISLPLACQNPDLPLDANAEIPQTTEAAPPATLRALDREKWERLTNGVSFQERQPKPRRPASNRGGGSGGNSGGSSRPPQPPSLPPGDFPMEVVRFVMFGILLALLVTVVFFMLKNRTRGNTRLAKPVAVELEALEKSDQPIPESQLDRLLREALAQKQYRLAIRVYFLAIMGRLSEKNRIQWQKGKTNRAYLQEMEAHADHAVFQHLVRFYERTWFGKIDLGENEYRENVPFFETFYQKL